MSVPILNYPEYLVEQNGDIYSTRTKKYLKPSRASNGYFSVELFNKNGSKRFLVHRIVANAYIPNPNNLPQINHKDENRGNNAVENLEWCTAKYNMNYGEGAKTRHSKIDYSKPVYKENAIKNAMSVKKPIFQYTKDGKFVARYDSAADAARVLGVNNTHISEAAKGKRKTSNGYIWKFERSDDLSVFQY